MPVGISSSRSLRIVVLVCSISLHFITGFSNDKPGVKNGMADNNLSTSNHGTGTKVLIICIVVIAVVLFSLFLFKMWQKKKREEHYARLLKLFEEDSELEVELGLRD
ncbi:hypothetical protein Nepgr_016208 [Nepenthes gracilis]|uniref:Uncharacterized protein n=1 Tax=Nepenthes gracilis TaxID=150966 RepID=A0AAD3XR40_NEPGR|nr:hypothetical protein Nepgr_016208 [Nepenthes gracilis]